MIKLNDESSSDATCEESPTSTQRENSLPRNASLDRTAEFIRQALTRLRVSTGPESFYRDWLAEIIAFTESPGGALRLRTETGVWTTPTNRGFPGIELGTEHAPTRHGELVFDTFVTAQAKLIPPHADRTNDPEANPTDQLLLIAPLVVGGSHRGVVELLLAPTSAEQARAEALRAILGAGAAFAEFYGRHQDRLQTKLACVEELESFTQAVHERLSSRHVSYVIANDGKRLVKCDRVSVLLRRGRSYCLAAVSGLEVVETRSQAAKLLCRLVSQASDTGEGLDYPGDLSSLALPVRRALEEYVDETHVRSLSIVPLSAKPPVSPGKEDATHPPEPTLLGAVVVEHFADAAEAKGQAERARFLAEHAASALANALRHERIPLLPLWRAWDRTALQFAPGTRKRTWAILAAVAAALATLVFLPADFTIHADGVLKPAEQRSAFAPWDGTVKKLLVRHGDKVAAGQPLLELENVDLQVALADTAGQQTAAQEELFAVKRSLYEKQSSSEETHRLSGRRSELEQKVRSLEEQLKLLRRKREQLVVTSPIAGEVVTWNLEQLLTNRPVRAGQVLVEVGKIDGDWELELQVPEDDIGHVVRAQRAGSSDLAVDYRLAAAPAHEYRATIREVHLSAEVRGEAGNTVLVRAALAGDEVLLRPGAAAATKIHCGRRALGYVWLHDAVDYLRTKVLFRL
jgi:multidrug efflux pump subunit AcrA (membrane-fusion protein)